MMRKIMSYMASMTIILLLAQPLVVIATEYYTYEGISDGHFVSGELYETDYPYLSYRFSEIEVDGEELDEAQFSPDATSYEMVIGEAIKPVTFAIEDLTDYNILGYEPEAISQKFPASYEDETGVVYTGTMTVTPINQNIYYTYYPRDGHDLEIDVKLQGNYIYEAIFEEGETVMERSGTMTLDKTMNLAHRGFEISHYVNQFQLDQVVEILAGTQALVFVADVELVTNEDFMIEDEGISLSAELLLPPLISEGSYMVSESGVMETSQGDPAPAVQTLPPTPVVPDPIDPLFYIVLSIGIAGACTFGGGGLGKGNNGGKTQNDKGQSFLEEVIMNKLNKKESFCQLVLNGGGDLAQVDCDPDNPLGISIYVNNARADSEWVFKAFTVVGRDHKNKISTNLLPGNGVARMIVISFKGNEVSKKRNCYCTVVAVNIKKASEILLETIEFELMPIKSVPVVEKGN